MKITIIGILGIIIVVMIWTTLIIKGINFTQGCGGYLKRAADANTVELAEQELAKALAYMKQNEMIEGYTSVLWRTPDEDVGFWYNNINSSYQELINLPDSASSLEKSNMLMKLRETLTDVSSGISSVPSGISRFPNNLLWGILNWTAFSIIIGAIILFMFYEASY